MILQATDTLKEIGNLADKQGQVFALLCVILVAAGIFLFWFVRTLVADNREARKEAAAEAKEARTEFLTEIRSIRKEAQDLDKERTRETIAAFDSLRDAIRNRR